MEIDHQFSSDPYRFVQLVIFMLLGIQTQILWVSFGPAMNLAAEYYHVHVNYITLIAALFMIVYIPMNSIATNGVDKYGLRRGVGIGVILTGLGGLIKALAGPNCWILFTGQILASIGQPYVLNSWTKLSTNWFLEREKTTAAGLGSISQFFGVIIAMIFPIQQIGIAPTLWFYAILGIIISIVFFIFAREKPPTPPNAYAMKNPNPSKKTRIIPLFLENLDFLLLFIIIFIGLGAFNAITSEIELIFSQENYPNNSAGMVSTMMIVGGIGGGISISMVSDHYRKRKNFLFLSFSLSIPITLVLALTQNLDLLYLFSFLFGFFMVSIMPVGLTYAAEITYPYPEEISAGLITLSGQISGILFLLIPSNQYLWWMLGLFVLGTIFCLLIHDTAWFEEKRKKNPIKSNDS